MNHAWLEVALSTSAVPVLPATSIPSRAAAVPVPSFTTLFIIPASCSAVSRFITWLCSTGCSRSSTRPSLATTRSVRRGRISSPPLPTAAATSAICSGLTRIEPSSPPCPIATRPMSKPPVSSTRSPLALRTPLASIWPSG